MDYHVIQNGASVQSSSFLLDHLPDRLHIVLSTRADPPWPLARFPRNQLVELRAKDLRFTTDETASFLNQVMGFHLSAEDVAALEGRTEGWIAGLQLAALSMQGRSDTAGFIKAFTGSHVYVAEYLVEEVLRHQSEEVQLFLLRTSILDRMNASLCQSVTGLQGSQAVLTALHRANIFVISLDDEGLWFRYHHLFADLLQARLRQTLPVDAITALHARASQWCQRNGFVAQAVNHAPGCAGFEAAADLIQRNASEVTIHGELTTLLQWIEELPAEVSRRHPQILISKAWSLTLAGAQPQVESLLREIEAPIEFSGETPEARELRGNAAAIRGYFAMLAGDHTRALELTEFAEALLPESSVQARSILPYTLGAAIGARASTKRPPLHLRTWPGSVKFPMNSWSGRPVKRESLTYAMRRDDYAKPAKRLARLCRGWQIRERCRLARLPSWRSPCATCCANKMNLTKPTGG